MHKLTLWLGLDEYSINSKICAWSVIVDKCVRKMASHQEKVRKNIAKDAFLLRLR